jgi:membrane-associated phospholipid phosphatase
MAWTFFHLPRSVILRVRDTFALLEEFAMRRRKRDCGNAKLSVETLEFRQLMASDWQNAANPYDVDKSGTVQVLDVYVTLNDYIAKRGDLPVRSSNSTEPYCDVNGDNQLSPSDVLDAVHGLNLYTNSQLSLNFDLNGESDGNGNEVVLKPQVLYVGTTLPYTKVKIEAVGSDTLVPTQEAISDKDGKFQFQLNLSSPLNHVKITANDARERTLSAEREIRLGNVVAEWNAMLLEVVRESTAPSSTVPGLLVKPPPPLAARQMAMIQVAMFDAINAVNPTYEGYAFDATGPQNVSEIAAAAAAAHRVATSLFSIPAQTALWDATLAESLALVPDGVAKTQGIALGHQAGDAILALRANDGSSTVLNYVPGTAPGDWQPTAPDFSKATLPQWPDVTPFVMSAGDQFRPGPAPALNSVEYANAVDQVMKLGAKDNSQRTADQTAIAKFWADGGGTATPPGHWNQIATDIGLEQNRPLIEQARALALLNLALADAAIVSWDAKYFYELWRPIDAIQKAGTDGNAATIADPNWVPLLNTPSFPSYTSGHSTFSGAAAVVLSSIYGENFQFSTLTDRGAAGIWPAPKDITGLATRSFTSFDQAAEEAGMSRIYGGIHFGFDNTAGLASGRSLGELVISGQLKPL